MKKESSTGNKGVWGYVLFCLGLGTILASHAVIIMTFVVGYYNNWQVMIYMNNHGEGMIEFIWLFLSLPAVIYAAVVSMWRYGR